MGSENIKISLAKALKVKNRLAGRLSKVTGDIQAYNSTLVEQSGKVDVRALLKQRDLIKQSLLDLKNALFQGNLGIQATIYELNEKKGDIGFYQCINTRDGKERHDYQNTDVTYKAILQKADIDSIVKTLEAQIDELQDKIDTYNHATKIELPQLVLDLAS